MPNAEITIFNADGTIAEDVNGQPCVGITNNDGEVDFVVYYDKTNQMYAKETNPPQHYRTNETHFNITPTNTTITIANQPAVIPSQTGLQLTMMHYFVVLIAFAGVLFVNKMRKKKNGNEI